MQSLFTFQGPVRRCAYLPDQRASLSYEIVGTASTRDYETRLMTGWRRFGHSFFRPTCPNCTRCLSLRVPIGTFRSDRSHRRSLKANADLRLEISTPDVSAEKLELYDRFHDFQTDAKDWPAHDPKEANDYAEMFLDNPFPTEEWRYYLGDRLIGVGYVDALPQGLSAIYFYYEPELRNRSLGTFNVMQLLARAAKLKLPHLYLGYYVEGCRSLEYKARFEPNEILDSSGNWQVFRG